MNIIGKKYIFLTISAVLILGSVVALSLWGLKRGIDFTGGSLLEVEFSAPPPAPSDISAALAPLPIGTVIAQPTGTHGMLIRFQEISEEQHQHVLLLLQSSAAAGTSVEEKRFDAIGPTIGKELEQRSLLAILLAIAAIVLYISWAFRKVSRPVASWKYGVATIVALVHDVILPSGAFAILGHFFGVEIDALFITALLTILGFSVHDTIVVFDRIRENLRKLKHAEPFATTVNRSMNETITRSINTSFTVLLVLVAILFFGGVTTKYFALALVIGIIFGTYSSIFIASPLLVIWHEFNSKKK